MILILAFWMIMARKNAMVPSKSQYLGETAYFFVRNTIARDMIGHDFRRYLPLLIALFSFVLVNNLWGVFPLSLLPTPSHVGWPYGLAILVWVIYNGVGIAKYRFLRLPQEHNAARGRAGIHVAADHPAGVRFQHHRPADHPVLATLRQHVRRSPAGAGVRVGRGVPAVCIPQSIINKTAGVVSLIFSMAIFGLEIFVQSLQAFIFTVLTAQYISSAAAEEH